MQENWYETFFQGVALDLWRQATTEELTRREADFLASELGAGPGARLLDVPCGNGRHSLELAARGCRMAAVDLSREFLAEAQAAAAVRSLTVDWKLGDMRDLPWAAKFDGAFCLGNSFAYLDHGGTREFLKAAARALKPGGRLVLQTGTAAECILPQLGERKWYRAGNILLLLENRYDPAQARLETEYTFVRDGRVETRRGSQGVYTAAEILRLLETAGLRAAALYGSIERQPFAAGARELIVTAEKR